MAMPQSAQVAFWNELPRLLAEAKLLMVEPIAAPHIKARAFRELVDRWETIVAGDGAKPAVTAPPPALLTLLGIAVRHVKPK